MNKAGKKCKKTHVDVHSISPPLFAVLRPLFTKFPELGYANVQRPGLICRQINNSKKRCFFSKKEFTENQ